MSNKLPRFTNFAQKKPPKIADIAVDIACKKVYTTTIRAKENFMDTSFLNDKKIEITGATGTVGKALTKTILRSATPAKLVLVNQSENNQVNFMRELAEEFTPEVLAPIQFCLLDIANYAPFSPLVVGAD